MRQQVKRDGVLQTDLSVEAVAKKIEGGGKGGTASTGAGKGMTRGTVAAPTNRIAPTIDMRALNAPDERLAFGTDTTEIAPAVTEPDKRVAFTEIAPTVTEPDEMVACGTDTTEVAPAVSEPDIRLLSGTDPQPATEARTAVVQADEPKERNRRDHTGVAKMGENLGALWLRRHGYKIIARNWRSGRFCEIDIVARNADGLLVFVEVKTRRLKAGPTPTLQTPNSSTFPDNYWTQQQAFESLDWRKRRKLVIAARSYIGRNHLSSDSCRLDAMIITYKSVMQEAGELRLDEVSVFHVPGAFSEI